MPKTTTLSRKILKPFFTPFELVESIDYILITIPYFVGLSAGEGQIQAWLLGLRRWLAPWMQSGFNMWATVFYWCTCMQMYCSLRVDIVSVLNLEWGLRLVWKKTRQVKVATVEKKQKTKCCIGKLGQWSKHVPEWKTRERPPCLCSNPKWLHNPCT